MVPSRTLLAAAIALAVVACTDTPTNPVDSGPAFAKPAESGVVERRTILSTHFFTDVDNELRVIIGFNRVKWCEDGKGPRDPVIRDYFTETELQRTNHQDGRRTDVRKMEGTLYVYPLGQTILDCTRDPIGVGTGRTIRTSSYFPGVNPPGEPPDVRKLSLHSFVTVADGSRKRVNATFTGWFDIQHDAPVIRENAIIILR